jgi:hypothetical protein
MVYQCSRAGSIPSSSPMPNPNPKVMLPSLPPLQTSPREKVLHLFLRTPLVRLAPLSKLVRNPYPRPRPVQKEILAHRRLKRPRMNRWASTSYRRNFHLQAKYGPNHHPRASDGKHSPPCSPRHPPRIILGVWSCQDFRLRGRPLSQPHPRPCRVAVLQPSPGQTRRRDCLEKNERGCEKLDCKLKLSK